MTDSETPPETPQLPPTEPPAGPAADLLASPPIPPAPAPKTHAGRIVAMIVGAVVVLVLLGAWLGRGGGSTATSSATATAPASASTATSSSTSAAAGELPAEIGGAPLLQGDVADALKDLMNSYAGETGVFEATGMYGTASRPEYMYLVLSADVPPGVDATAVLRLSASASGYELSGEPVTVRDGGTTVTCSAMTAPNLSAMCLVTGEQTAMAMALHASPQETADDVLAAVT